MFARTGWEHNKMTRWNNTIGATLLFIRKENSFHTQLLISQNTVDNNDFSLNQNFNKFILVWSGGNEKRTAKPDWRGDQFWDVWTGKENFFVRVWILGWTKCLNRSPYALTLWLHEELVVLRIDWHGHWSECVETIKYIAHSMIEYAIYSFIISPHNSTFHRHRSPIQWNQSVSFSPQLEPASLFPHLSSPAVIFRRASILKRGINQLRSKINLKENQTSPLVQRMLCHKNYNDSLVKNIARIANAVQCHS